MQSNQSLLADAAYQSRKAAEDWGPDGLFLGRYEFRLMRQSAEHVSMLFV